MNQLCAIGIILWCAVCLVLVYSACILAGRCDE
jgi:hypothetical protein